MSIFKHFNGHIDDAGGFDPVIPRKYLDMGEFSEIGRGSTCRVYKIGAEVPLALKVIDCGQNAAAYLNAVYEKRVMESLSGCRSAVTMIDFDTAEAEDGGRTVFFLENYYDSLEAVLAAKRLTLKEILGIVSDICAAVIEVAGRGVLHLDLKPKNIFFDGDGSVRLGDFGSALFESDLAKNSSPRGTLGFMAPEVYQEHLCGEQSEVYSIGLILYYLLNGMKIPFSDSAVDAQQNELALYKRLAGTELPPLPVNASDGTAKAVNDLIRHACAYNPENRIKTVAELKYEIEAAAQKAKDSDTVFSMLPVPADETVTPVVLMIDASDKERADRLNETVRRLLGIFEEECSSASGNTFRVAVMKYSGGVEWTVPVPTAPEDIVLDGLNPGGPADLGGAIRELDSKLSRSELLRGIEHPASPIVIWLTGGNADGDWKDELQKTHENAWYRTATVICVAFGDVLNPETLKTLCGGSSELVIGSERIEDIRFLISGLGAAVSEIHNPSPGSPGNPSFSLTSLDADPFGATFAHLPFGTFSETHEPHEHAACRVCGGAVGSDAVFCPYCGSKLVIQKPAVQLSDVEFSAVAPKKLVKGEYSVVNIVMYESEYRKIVDEIHKRSDVETQETGSGKIAVPGSAQIKVILTSPDISIEDNEMTGFWRGSYLNFPFSVSLPDNYAKRQVAFTAKIYVDGILTTRLAFNARRASIYRRKIAVTRSDVKTAFVSYDSRDRKRVVSMIQGMKKVRSDMDIFLDVERLRSGDDWKKVLFAEIDKRDVLYLCWSHFAKESEWVDREWRYAYLKKGAEGIEPLPVELLDDCPPPQELNGKHWNDMLLYLIEHEDKRGGNSLNKYDDLQNSVVI